VNVGQREIVAVSPPSKDWLLHTMRFLNGNMINAIANHSHKETQDAS